MTGRVSRLMLPQPRGELEQPGGSPVAMSAVVAAEGVAFAVLAGLDGSAGWQAARSWWSSQ